jgi:transcriptional regulator with XRE-family HTH domain
VPEVEHGKFNGALLRHWRQVRGLSLEALGEAIGSDGPYVSRMERGETGEPRAATQRKLAKELGISVTDLQDTGEQRSDVQEIEAMLVRRGWSAEDIRSTMRQILLIESERQRKARKR